MVLFTRTMAALPGKFFELIAVTKEMQKLVKRAVGMDVAVYAVSGGALGELVSMLVFNNFAHYEDVVTTLLADPEYRSTLGKIEGLVAPGAHDQLLRSI